MRQWMFVALSGIGLGTVVGYTLASARLWAQRRNVRLIEARLTREYRRLLGADEKPIG